MNMTYLYVLYNIPNLGHGPGIAMQGKDTGEILLG